LVAQGQVGGASVRMVSNVPNYCQEEVSDHTISMLLSLARRIPQNHRSIR
jgi:lactate dehydrogenase-like 2-hydroxyacid dehydrogenase